MVKKKTDDLVEVVAAHGFIDPKTRQAVRIGELYRTTQANAEEMIALRQARWPKPGEYDRRDMRARS
jgi:hypothetical protein